MFIEACRSMWRTQEGCYVRLGRFTRIDPATLHPAGTRPARRPSSINCAPRGANIHLKVGANERRTTQAGWFARARNSPEFLERAASSAYQVTVLIKPFAVRASSPILTKHIVFVLTAAGSGLTIQLSRRRVVGRLQRVVGYLRSSQYAIA